MEGKELRLKQEYFLCSASLQDIVRRYKQYKSKSGGGTRSSFKEFPEKVRLIDTIIITVFTHDVHVVNNVCVCVEEGGGGRSGCGIRKHFLYAINPPKSIHVVCHP